MALASKEDFEARHGAGDDRIEALLADASSLILNEVEGSAAAWASTEETEDVTVPDVVVGVCVAIAYRAWSNPDALSSEQLGAHTQAWADRSGEALQITKAERRIVKRAANRSSFRAATLATPYSGDGEGDGITESDLEL